MGKEGMQRFEELSKKDIYELTDLLEHSRHMFGLFLEEDNFSGLMESAEDSYLIYQLISAKHINLRENVFVQDLHLYCASISQEEFELAGDLLDRLRYFQGVFLRDSEFRDVDLTNLKEVKLTCLYDAD